jgi:hypothetical protein
MRDSNGHSDDRSGFQNDRSVQRYGHSSQKWDSGGNLGVAKAALRRFFVVCRWGLSRCDKPVRAERTERTAEGGRYADSLRRSARRYGSQREPFHLSFGG